MRGSRFKARLERVKLTGLLVLLLGASGCEFFRGYVREVRVAVPPPESCIRTSLREVPGLAVYAQGRYREPGFWFNWSADPLAQGSVSVYRKDSGAILRLKTGGMTSCDPAALARGRAVMNSLYERLWINCGGLPEPIAVKERRIRACDD